MFGVEDLQVNGRIPVFDVAEIARQNRKRVLWRAAPIPYRLQRVDGKRMPQTVRRGSTEARITDDGLFTVKPHLKHALLKQPGEVFHVERPAVLSREQIGIVASDQAPRTRR